MKEFNENIFYNLTAEVDILGGLLFDNNTINALEGFVKKTYFYNPIHGEIFESIERLINKRRVADPMTVSNNLASNKDFTEAGGIDYLYKIASKYAESSFAVNLAERGKLLKSLHIERKLLEALKQAQEDLANKKTEEPTEKIENLERELFKITEEAERGKEGFTSIEKIIDFSINHIKKIKEEGLVRGMPSGFADLAKIISGFQNSDLVIIAGRPSMGKTSFAISIAINVAEFLQKKKEDGVVAVFSLEMSSEQLGARVLSVFSGINSNKLLSGMIDMEDMESLVETAEKFKNFPLYLDDTPAITINALRTKARRLKKQNGLKMIIIDYLQLLKTSSKTENRVQEISEITQGLKAIAKELDVPVIALSQLSRNVEMREDKRPQLQDLRESGSIEQDADIVMFVYREEYYIERAMPTEFKNKDPQEMGDIKKQEDCEKWREKLLQSKNRAEIIVAKHRNGRIGTAILYFDSATTKFENFAETSYAPTVSTKNSGYFSSTNQSDVKKFVQEKSFNYNN